MLGEDNEELAEIPAGALMVMKILADQLRAVDAHLSAIDEQIEAWQRESAAVQALKTIPGVGALISAALAAHIPDPSMFRSGRDFSAWLGLYQLCLSATYRSQFRATARARIRASTIWR